VVVPARNEAGTLPLTLPLLLAQDYPGDLRVIVVDDRSDDGTAAAARREGGAPDTIGPTGHARHGQTAADVVPGAPLPEGWARSGHSSRGCDVRLPGPLLRSSCS
jgi:glycosyltransferase involved in cell wall biosynthesis